MWASRWVTSFGSAMCCLSVLGDSLGAADPGHSPAMGMLTPIQANKKPRNPTERRPFSWALPTLSHARCRPERPGLIETPARVARAFEEFFAGYDRDPALILAKTFEEIEGYDELIVLRGIGFESH
jgi:GTP cyclohydrolase I